MMEIRHEGMLDTAATLDAYNQIYSSQGILHRDSFYLWLIGLLSPRPGHSLLDISCGYGRLVTLAQRTGLKAIGIDFAVDGVRVGRLESPNSGWAVGDGEMLPLADQSVDYITHIGSLEHFMSPQDGANEIGRVLKADGLACVLVPNAFGLWGNIKYVWRHGEIFDDGQPLQRYATCMTWQKMLEAGGLRVERVLGYGEVDWPRTAGDRSWLLKRPQKILRFFLSALIPVNLSNHFVFLCRRARS